MVKITLIKSPDEWAITKQACRDELVLYLSFSSHNIYIALLLCIEHCFTKVKILHFIYIAFKPDDLTYTWVSFAILSNIPSGNEFKGLSKMVLKMRRVYTH